MLDKTLNKTMWFILILSLASVALAQEQVQLNLATKRVEAPSPEATQTCQVTYSTGTFNTGTQFCVTVNGNIPMFTVRGYELFAPAGNPADSEGYGICDVTANNSPATAQGTSQDARITNPLVMGRRAPPAAGWPAPGFRVVEARPHR